MHSNRSHHLSHTAPSHRSTSPNPQDPSLAAPPPARLPGPTEPHSRLCVSLAQGIRLAAAPERVALPPAPRASRVARRRPLLEGGTHACAVAGARSSDNLLSNVIYRNHEEQDREAGARERSHLSGWAVCVVVPGIRNNTVQLRSSTKGGKGETKRRKKPQRIPPDQPPLCRYYAPTTSSSALRQDRPIGPLQGTENVTTRRQTALKEAEFSLSTFERDFGEPADSPLTSEARKASRCQPEERRAETAAPPRLEHTHTRCSTTSSDQQLPPPHTERTQHTHPPSLPA